MYVDPYLCFFDMCRIRMLCIRSIYDRYVENAENGVGSICHNLLIIDRIHIPPYGIRSPLFGVLKKYLPVSRYCWVGSHFVYEEDSPVFV